MKWVAALVCVAASVVAMPAFGQVDTATPTNTVPTATPTNTPTITNTPTPTLRNAFVTDYACPTQTPICEVRPGIPALHDGYKTVSLTTTAGSGATQLRCIAVASDRAPAGTLDTMTGAACPTPGACVTGFWENCEELYLGVPGGATVSAWFNVVRH